MKTTTITIVSDDEGFAPIINRWKRAVENLRTAKAGDWKTKPLSLDNHYVIRTDIPIPAVAMNRIRQGHIPREMEDKWFMYYADGIIHYHRSWTGYNIFNAYCEKREEGYAITKIEVDTEEYKSSPDRAKEALDNFLKLLARQCDVCMDYPIGIRVLEDTENETTQQEQQ